MQNLADELQLKFEPIKNWFKYARRMDFFKGTLTYKVYKTH